MDRDKVLSREDQAKFDRMQAAVSSGHFDDLGHYQQMEYYAMRTILDYASGSTSSSLHDATVWIKRVYTEGKRDGTHMTNQAHRKRILGVFGLSD